MNITQLLNGGIFDISETALRFYTNSRIGFSYMLKAAGRFRKSAKIRDEYENKGIHIPPFLIASITSSCNLHCAGCYARANRLCSDSDEDINLSAADWRRIFGEASDIGISFILLAGGEPLMRRDIIEAAAETESILFPVFTNGTLIDEAYLDLFDGSRNLIPVLSIEGHDDKTDARRGLGVSGKISSAVLRLKEKNLLFGASITVTRENMSEVTGSNFLAGLREAGCGIVFYVEYVPAEAGTDSLVLTDSDLKTLNSSVEYMRADHANRSMIILSFPGDEEAMGGCLAAGRGFFHINPSGGAEPCPFSPFSAMNLKEQTIMDVLQSPFFEKVRAVSAAEALNHKGGCTLFQHKTEVLRALKK